MKVLAFITFLLVANIGWAQSKPDSKKYIKCENREGMTAIVKRLEQVAIISLNSVQVLDQKRVQENWLVLYVDPQTKTWSLIEQINDNWFCILAIGTDFNIIGGNGGGGTSISYARSRYL